MEKKTMSEEQEIKDVAGLDEYHYYEVLDRAFVFCEQLHDTLYQHIAVQLTEDWKKRVMSAISTIYGVACEAAEKHDQITDVCQRFNEETSEFSFENMDFDYERE
jgi:hypothetical protein